MLRCRGSRRNQAALVFINRLKRSLWLGHHLRDSLDTDHNTDRAPRSEDTQSSQSGAYSICAPLPSFCLPLLALHRIATPLLHSAPRPPTVLPSPPYLHARSLRPHHPRRHDHIRACRRGVARASGSSTSARASRRTSPRRWRRRGRHAS